jgi:hypothetical protein
VSPVNCEYLGKLVAAELRSGTPSHGQLHLQAVAGRREIPEWPDGREAVRHPKDYEVLALIISAARMMRSFLIALPGPRSPTNKAGINETIPRSYAGSHAYRTTMKKALAGKVGIP